VITPWRCISVSIRRGCFLLLATLLLMTGRTTSAAIVDVAVSIGGFGPDDITIQPGDTVRWTWNDTHIHTVTSGADFIYDGMYNSGNHVAPYEFSYTFQKVGTYHYFCIPHIKINMVGVVRVVESTGQPAVFGNISTRLRVDTGNNVLIGGFIISGIQPKRVIVRAIGPSLSSFFPGALADPVLELRDSSGNLIRSNDNWRNDQEAEVTATGIPPINDLESAIVATLPANNSAYTAIVRGVNNGTGTGVVEAYDLDQTVNSKLANISTRGLVETGDDVLIGGLIVSGQNSLRVIVRAIGPSLPVSGALNDPTLELRDGNGTLMASNDNWRSDQESEIIATSIPPSNDLESAIVRNLSSGNYTAIIRGAGNITGVALVEAYDLN
jgi:plastocyanin